MIAKLKARYAQFIATKSGAVINRVVIAAATIFAATFVAQASEVHLFTVPNFLDISLWHVVLAAALNAAYASVLTALQSLLSLVRTGAPQLLKRTKAAFVARRAEFGLAA